MIKLTNQIKDNLSLAYIGYNFNKDKLQDWAAVYRTLTQVADPNQQQLLNKLNQKINDDINSKKIDLMKTTQLVKVVNTGQFNGESYELNKDYSSLITWKDCRAMLKQTLFKSIDSDGQIGIYALIWSSSLVVGYSAYFGIVINDNFYNLLS